eukprot:TRINITY_DN11570_c0_g1_i3.p1 TRINITY_DN11570_c0_g1~~TRINITY_DN11570_c0_g1_i3.p1  ORF type:complete len:216 (+),score=28.46 TRINITY_DN11570_c0_g1_i3:88-648(+)
MASSTRRSLLACAALAVFALFLCHCLPSFLHFSNSPRGRRDVVQGAAAAIASLGCVQGAWADIYGSKGAALGQYAPRILGLKDAVESGDFAAVLNREKSFRYCNGYWATAPDVYAEKQKLVDDLLAAAKNGDRPKTKELWSQYVSDSVLQQWAIAGARKAKKIMTPGRTMTSVQDMVGEINGPDSA